jgi:hypothetical protein
MLAQPRLPRFSSRNPQHPILPASTPAARRHTLPCGPRLAQAARMSASISSRAWRSCRRATKATTTILHTGQSKGVTACRVEKDGQARGWGAQVQSDPFQVRD